jgi:high-affinity nickel-transport protein
MILTDTMDGISMKLAYGWAFQHPIRKVYYNLTKTIMSVLVAFVIGGVEFLQVISSELS